MPYSDPEKRKAAQQRWREANKDLVRVRCRQYQRRSRAKARQKDS